MRVVRLTAPRTFKVFDEPTPGFEDDHVLLKIESVGVCGSDLHRFRGAAFDDEDNSNIVLGHEFSATVAEVGKAVTNVTPGDRVAVEAANHCGQCEWCLQGYTNLCPNVKFCGLPGVEGALKEYMAWPAHLLHTLPDSLTFDDGVLAEVMGICLFAIDLANMKPGQTAAVLGSGPIGLGVAHLLKRTTGARLIVATDIIQDRCQAALQLGADVSFNSNDMDAEEQILELAHGRGVDVVFEAAGVSQTCELSVQIAAPGGKVVLIGIPEDDRIPFAATPARRKGLTFRFVRRSLNTYPRVLAMMENKIIEPQAMVTHHFSLEESQQAFELVDSYSDGVLKAIIHLGD